MNQIKSDWHLLAWAAKWLGDPPSKIMYMDQRRSSPIENDKKILKGIWHLLNEADIVITQNGKSFDEKKLNARFILQGFKPPKSYKHIDTKLLAARKFGFTSNKLEYLSDNLCKRFRKSKHGAFSGFELWSQCLQGNKKAWDEMEKYNKNDVLSLEELYKRLQPWDSSSPNFNLYSDDLKTKCNCGSGDFSKNGFRYERSGKFQRYTCRNCGAETRGKINLFVALKKLSLKN